MRQFSRKILTAASVFMLSTSAISLNASAHDVICEVDCPTPKIQIALLLDTSNSMDGLISQTKSQLWMLVNELGETDHNGQTPQIELALYEYGNSNVSVAKGYIRQVMPLSTDLDGVSEKLFALKTQGGQEYAGQVISTAVENLEWSDNPADMKLVIIAGNEPFTQGPVNYRTACEQAREKGILIDTIHCGDEKIGIDTEWKAGADCGGGIYMTINQDEVAQYIASPYDDEILQLNKALNDTYFGYGSLGESYKERQIVQDSNASSMSVSSAISRAKSKSSVQYNNATWDIVDRYKDDRDSVLEMEEAALPDEMKGMSAEEKVAFIEGTIEKREKISEKISTLETQRTEFVDKKRSEMAEEQTLEQVVVSAVRAQAATHGFK